MLKTVYKGPADNYITVMQTGGLLSPVNEDSRFNLEIEGGPIFTGGDEYILFLKDISGDKVHSQNRELYRIINPAGRYAIDGDIVPSFADVAGFGWQKTGEWPCSQTPVWERLKQQQHCWALSLFCNSVSLKPCYYETLLSC